MRADRVFHTVDFHTGGIGMRLITSGIPRLPGPSLAEQRRHFQEHLDWIRTGLCLPPRGHAGMLIAMLVPPVSPAAAFGLLFMYPGGYYVSCGEATIGAATVALETGLVPREGAETLLVIDTEAGPIETVVHADADRVHQVTLRWIPSYVALADQAVEVEGAGEVPVDVSVGAGNVFAIVEAGSLGLAVRPEHTRRIAQRGMAVRDAVNAQLRVEVPRQGKVAVDNVIVHELPGADGVSLNALVWGPGQVNAAPCGSGTCARMALLHHRWRMAVGQTLISKGLAGLCFTGRIAGETAVDGRRAILPELSGRAHLTGFGQVLFDPDDPMRQGFLPEA
jgi:proline racemase